MHFLVNLYVNGHCVLEIMPNPMLLFFAVIQRCVSSYRAIIYYRSSEHTKHKMPGRSSVRHTKNNNLYLCTL